MGDQWGINGEAMRNAVIGVIIGVVLGVVIGATVIAPRIPEPRVRPGPSPAQPSETKAAPADGDNATPAAARKRAPEAQAAGTASSSPTVRWKMASAYAGALPLLGALALRVQTETWRVSGGGIEIAFHEPGALVPVADMFDAVSSGALDAAFAPLGLWGGRIPALGLFGAVPFGPPVEEYLSWAYFGGGEGLLGEILGRHNIHGVFCGIAAAEAAGWFRRQVRTVDDLKGLKMRIAGLGAEVMRKLGVEALALAEGDIFPALESGAIDAAEFSMPAIDRLLGFDRLVRYYYFPGWHRPATLFVLMVNRSRWEALSTAQRAQIEVVCGDNIRHGLAEGEAIQFAALKELTAKGVHIRRWPNPILQALRRAWREVAAERAAADADFRKVWQSIQTFREEYAIWRELARP